MVPEAKRMALKDWEDLKPKMEGDMHGHAHSLFMNVKLGFYLTWTSSGAEGRGHLEEDKF